MRYSFALAGNHVSGGFRRGSSYLACLRPALAFMWKILLLRETLRPGCAGVCSILLSGCPLLPCARLSTVGPWLRAAQG